MTTNKSEFASEFTEAFAQGIKAVLGVVPEVGKIIETTLDIGEPLSVRWQKVMAAQTDESLRCMAKRAEIAIEMAKAGVPVEVMLRFFPEPSDESTIYEKLIDVAPGAIVRVLEVLRAQAQHDEAMPRSTLSMSTLSIFITDIGHAVDVGVADSDTMGDVVANLIGPGIPGFFLQDAERSRLPDDMTIEIARALGRLPVRLMTEVKDAETETPA